MSDQPIVYLWLDLETTGLDPRYDDILEVAWHVTTADLQDITTRTYSYLVDEPDVVMSPQVALMHARSGLLEALTSEPPSALEYIEALILGDIPPDCTVQLAGSGIHFDKAFIERCMPRLAERLHYRVMDVSIVRRFYRDVCGLPISRDQVAHRAAADVDQALAEMRLLRAEALS